MSTTTLQTEHTVTSRGDWLVARRELLKKEKEITKLKEKLAADRRDLPWVKVDKDYVFEGPGGKVTLAGLFGKNSQLIIYHFMFDPSWDEGCPGCSFLSDHVDGARQHFGNRDVSYAAVSRAPLEKIEAFKKRMGWKFPWVSSEKNDFNYDYNVSFTEEQVAKGEAVYNYEPNDEAGETPGASVFYKNEAGEIFHTYSAYGRGLEETLGTFVWMDLTPKGRNEEGTMNWIRHHDKYDNAAEGCRCH